MGEKIFFVWVHDYNATSCPNSSSEADMDWVELVSWNKAKRYEVNPFRIKQNTLLDNPTIRLAKKGGKTDLIIKNRLQSKNNLIKKVTANNDLVLTQIT